MMRIPQALSLRLLSDNLEALEMAEAGRDRTSLDLVEAWSTFRSLDEQKSDSIAMVIAEFQPFVKGWSKFVRKLSESHDKVIICVVTATPIGFDQTKGLVELSLADAVTKLEIYSVESHDVHDCLEAVKSKGSPSYKGSQAVEIYSADPNAAGALQNSDVDTTAVQLKEIPDGLPERDETALELIDSDDKAEFLKLLDPTVSSNVEKFDEVWSGLVGTKLDEDSEIGPDSNTAKSPRIKPLDIGNIRKTLAVNRPKLLKRGIDPDSAALGNGMMGVAYGTKDGRVLKVTTDHLEANAQALIMKKPGEHLAKVFDVFKFPNSELFGIVMERLQPTSDEEKQQIDFIMKLRSVKNWIDLPDVLEAGHIYDTRLEKGALAKEPFEKKEKLMRGLIKKFGIEEMMLELSAAGISSFNDLHRGNVMKRGSTYVLIDPGFSKGAKANIPVAERKVVREFLEDLGGTREEGLEELMAIVESCAALLAGRGVNMECAEYLGAGRNGAAWRLGSQQVFKVTTDEAEAANAYSIMGHDAAHVYKINDVFKFPAVYNDCTIYGILQEGELEKLADSEKCLLDDMFTTLEDSGIDINSFDSNEELVAELQELRDEGDIDPSDYDAYLELLEHFQIGQMVDDLHSLGISDSDIHAGNIMQRGENYVLIDLGTAGDSPKAELDEALSDAGGEDGIQSILKMNATVLKAQKGIDISSLRRLGAGSMGVAFDMGGGKVLKITTDEDEVKAVGELIGKQNQHINNFYDSFALAGGKVPTFGIIEDKLTPLSDQELSDFENFFGEFMNLDPVRKGKIFNSLASKPWDSTVQLMQQNFIEDAEQENNVNSSSSPKVRDRAIQGATRKLALFKTAAERFQIPDIIKELRKAGIHFADLHGQNILKRGTNYVLNDLSGAKTGQANEEVNEWMGVPAAISGPSQWANGPAAMRLPVKKNKIPEN